MEPKKTKYHSWVAHRRADGSLIRAINYYPGMAHTVADGALERCSPECATCEWKLAVQVPFYIPGNMYECKAHEQGIYAGAWEFCGYQYEGKVATFVKGARECHYICWLRVEEAGLYFEQDTTNQTTGDQKV